MMTSRAKCKADIPAWNPRSSLWSPGRIFWPGNPRGAGPRPEEGRVLPSFLLASEDNDMSMERRGLEKERGQGGPQASLL